MGTRFNLLLPGLEDSEGSALFAAIHRELSRLENIMSSFIPSSEISYINTHAHGNRVVIGVDLFEILTCCKKYYESTRGLFDVGIGKQIDYWKENIGNPDQDTCPFNSGMKDLYLDERKHSVFFGDENLKINLGGFGKGYALDKVVEILKTAGVNTAYLSFGESSIVCLGAHPHGDHWPVGLEDYFNKGHVLYTIRLLDEALSTSGNQDQHEHIVNPGTGLLLKRPGMVSVKSTSATEAEVWSTALACADEDQYRELTERRKNLEVIKATFYDGKWNFWEKKSLMHENY